MAEETVTAEPKEEQTTLKDFGSLSEAFDRVFTATAEEPAAAAEKPPEPKAATPTPPEPEKPVGEPTVPPEKASVDELPDFLTGKAPEEPAKPAEPELPPPRANESVGMKQLRTAYEALKKQRQTEEAKYQSQIEELKKAPQTPPDTEATIKQLERERDQLREAVERGAIEFSPYVQQKYVQPRENLINSAHTLLKNAGVEPALWDKAMALSGVGKTEALEDIYNELPKSVSAKLGAMEAGLDALDTAKQAELSDRKGMIQKLQEQQLLQQREHFKRQEEQTVRRMELAEKELVEKYGFEVLRKSDSPEHKKWNDSVDDIKTTARKILLEVDDEDVLARAAFSAASAPYYRQLYHTMRDRWQEAEKKLKAIEAAEPTEKTRGELTEAEDKNLTFAEAVAKSAFSP